MADTPNTTRRPLAATDSNRNFSTPNFLKTVLADTTPLKHTVPDKPNPTCSTAPAATSIPTPSIPSPRLEPPAQNQNKRKASELEAPNSTNETPSNDPRLSQITDDCDEIRKKIRTYLNSGEMTVGEFQKAIGCIQNNSYTRFMAHRGPFKGDKNEVYLLAFAFFKKRELAGIKMPRKKVKKGEEKNEELDNIHLNGEKEVAVEVYDNCDEIRKKVNAYLREKGVTQAGFLREIAKTYSDGRKIQSKVLNEFLVKKGPAAGNRSAVFYASYVFFEKMRIRDDKPKSKHRLEMEKLYKDEGGLDTKSGAGGKVGGKGGGGARYTYCLEGDNPWEDGSGRIHFN